MSKYECHHGNSSQPEIDGLCSFKFPSLCVGGVFHWLVDTQQKRFSILVSSSASLSARYGHKVLGMIESSPTDSNHQTPPLQQSLPTFSQSLMHTHSGDNKNR